MVSSSVDELPFVDEHAIDIAADSEAVWTALVGRDGFFASTPGSIFARAVGCTDTAPAGPRPLTEGSSMVGFHVVSAAPRSELVLAGRHRFSDYALIFRIDDIGGGRSRLRAE